MKSLPDYAHDRQQVFQNHREFPRLPKEVSVEVSELSYPLSTTAQEVVMSKNISPMGVSFKSTTAYQPGTVLTVKVHLLGLAAP